MNPNEPVAKSGTSRYRWLWISLVAVLATGPAMLMLLVVRYFLLSVDPNQGKVQTPALTDRQPLPQQTRPSDAVSMVPAAVPATPAAPIHSKVLPHVLRIRVRFNDFDTVRTTYALIVEAGDSKTHLIAPSEMFAPVTGKVNGRVVIRGANKRIECDLWQPGFGAGIGVAGMEGGMGMAPGGFGMASPMQSAGSMGGAAMAMPGTPYGMSGGMSSSGDGFGSGSFTFTSLKELPDTGLVVVLIEGIVWDPIRVHGDSPKASVGDKLTVVSLLPSADTSSELTVVGVDEFVQSESGKRLDHLIKLTAWTGEPGVVVCNAKGDPVGQIVLTTSGSEGTRLSYAVPMDRIFQAFYSQSAPSDSNMGMSMGPMGGGGTSPFGTGRSFGAGESSAASGLAADVAANLSGLYPVDIGPADAINPEQSVSAEVRAYRVLGNASDRAETIRSLFGDVAKIAVDRDSQSVIVMASDDVHQKVEAIIRRAEESGKELKRAAALEKERTQREQADRNQSQLAAALDEAAKNEAADEEAHRKEPRRTRLVKVPGRKPEEIARLLTELFGEKANIAVDEPTGAVLITINRAETWGEVQFLLAEIEATATRLISSDVTGGMAVERPVARRPNSSNRSSMGAGMIAGEPVSDDSDSALDKKARQLAIRLRTAAPTAVPTLRGELEQLTVKHFEQRQALRKQEIDELTSRVDQLRMTHQRRQQNKSEVIQRRIRELLDPNKDLNWDEARTGLQDAATSLVGGAGPGVLKQVPQAMITDAPTGKSSDTSSETAGSAEKTFDGVPYSQWLTMLKTEQKRAKLTVAVEACSRLAKPEDVREIIRGIFLAAAVIERESKEREDASLLNSALNRLPASDVVDELLVALNASETYKTDHAFLGYYLAFGCSEAVANSLAGRDQEIVQALIQPALQTEQNQDRDWLLAAACRIWRLTVRPASDFEGLLPLVIQCLDSGPTVEGQRLRPEWRYVVESLIVKIPETPELAMKLMNQAAQNSLVLELVGKMGRHAESVVPLIVDDFVREWNTLESVAKTVPDRISQLRGLDPNHLPRLVLLITALGEIGRGEKGAVLLRDLNLIGREYNRREPVFQVTVAAAVTAKAKYAPLLDSHKVPLLLSDSTMLLGRWNWTTLNPGTAPPNYAIQFSHDRTVHRHATRFEQLGAYDQVKLPEAFAVPIWGFTGASAPQRYEIDPAKSPKRISLVYPGFEGEKSEIRREGIYELTETTLRIQLSANDSPPTAFATDATMIPEGQVLLELTRALPDAIAGPTLRDN